MAIIQNDYFYRTTYDGKTDFFKGRVSTPSGETAFIFISVPLMSLLRDAEEIHSDATFEIVPNLFYQLFTLHITAYGKVIYSINRFDNHSLNLMRLYKYCPESPIQIF